MLDRFDHHDDYYKARDLKDAIVNAFFRQTSKLGLEFFQSKGIKVIFQWSNKKGQSMNKTENKRDLKDRWWLNKNYELATNKNKYGSITYSEMRHVERLAKKLGEKNLNVEKITGKVNSDVNSLF